MDTTEDSMMALLTAERINKAFERMQQKTAIQDGRLVLITEDYHTATLNFLKESFFKDEVLSKALGVKWSDQLEALLIGVFNAHLSLMLIGQENDDIMGVRLINLSKKDEKMNAEDFTDEGTRKMIAFMLYGAGKAKMFEHYNIKEAIQFFGLGVAEKYRQRGVGTMLVKAAVNFIEQLEIYPIYLKVEGNSNFSKRIFDKLGFEMLAEVFYAEYKVNGETLICNTGEEQSQKMYGKAILGKKQS